MNFKLNNEFKPNGMNEMFILVDGVQALIDQRRQTLIDLKDAHDDTSRTVAGYALANYMEYNALLDKMYPSVDGTPRVKIVASQEDLQKIQDMVNNYSAPKLAEQDGHVTQVWQDGEITTQKCGDLLWQRTLHCSSPGFAGVDLPIEWPAKHGYTKPQGYIFCLGLHAIKIREAIFQLIIKHIVGQQQ